MKKVLVLHGWEAKPENHWMPWLGEEMKKKWYEFHAPALSNTDYPVLEDQLKDLDDIKVQSGDTIIGHSLGCQLALQMIQKRELSWVNVVLVAPVYPSLADETGEDKYGDAYHSLFSYINEYNDFRNINKLDNKYTIFLSDDDPFINQYAAEEYYMALENLEIVHFEWKWHFSTQSKTFQLPEILKYI